MTEELAMTPLGLLITVILAIVTGIALGLAMYYTIGKEK